ncbi:MAG: hypothetical protein LUD17_12540 [Bacteroidales bacterium]|nr:hypothetical protein [Bacteroidales bacterium]
MLKKFFIVFFSLLVTFVAFSQERVQYKMIKTIERDGTIREIGVTETLTFKGNTIWCSAGSHCRMIMGMTTVYDYHHTEGGNKVYYLHQTGSNHGFYTDIWNYDVYLLVSSDNKKINACDVYNDGTRKVWVYERFTSSSIGPMIE